MTEPLSVGLSILEKFSPVAWWRAVQRAPFTVAFADANLTDAEVGDRTPTRNYLRAKIQERSRWYGLMVVRQDDPMVRLRYEMDITAKTKGRQLFGLLRLANNDATTGISIRVSPCDPMIGHWWGGGGQMCFSVGSRPNRGDEFRNDSWFRLEGRGRATALERGGFFEGTLHVQAWSGKTTRVGPERRCRIELWMEPQ